MVTEKFAFLSWRGAVYFVGRNLDDDPLQEGEVMLIDALGADFYDHEHGVLVVFPVQQPCITTARTEFTAVSLACCSPYPIQLLMII